MAVLTTPLANEAERLPLSAGGTPPDLPEGGVREWRKSGMHRSIPVYVMFSGDDADMVVNTRQSLTPERQRFVFAAMTPINPAPDPQMKTTTLVAAC